MTKKRERRGTKGTNKEFCLTSIKLVDSLPKNAVGRAIGNQLVRCETSVGANYRSACRGRSKADFISKLGIVVEEADESYFWLELLIDGKTIKRE
jgi:four helix bundle protein